MTSTAEMKASVRADPIPWWLFGCAGLLATTVTVGAASRLTKAGVSMIYHKPQGRFLPRRDSDWLEEYDHYRKFPELHHQPHPMVTYF